MGSSPAIRRPTIRSWITWRTSRRSEIRLCFRRRSTPVRASGYLESACDSSRRSMARRSTPERLSRPERRFLSELSLLMGWSHVSCGDRRARLSRAGGNCHRNAARRRRRGRSPTGPSGARSLDADEHRVRLYGRWPLCPRCAQIKQGPNQTPLLTQRCNSLPNHARQNLALNSTLPTRVRA